MVNHFMVIFMEKRIVRLWKRNRGDFLIGRVETESWRGCVYVVHPWSDHVLAS